MMTNQWSERLIGLYLLLRDLLSDLPPSQEPFSSLCLSESLIFLPNPPPLSIRHKKPQTDVRSLKSFPSLPFHKPPYRVHLFRPYHPSFTSQTLCFLLLQRPRAIYSLTVPSALRLPFNLSSSLSLSLFLFPPVHSLAEH